MTGRRSVVTIIAWTLAVISCAISVLLVLESYLLSTGQAPITFYVECATASFPLATLFVACVIAASLGALFAHFWWPAR